MMSGRDDLLGVEMSERWTLRLPQMPERSWVSPDAKASVASCASRMRILAVLPSTLRPDWGAGEALAQRMAATLDRVDWELVIDDGDGGSVEAWESLASAHGLTAHIGKHDRRDGELEPINRDLGAIIRRGTWDGVELVGATSRVSNLTAIEVLAARSTLVIYAPHVHELMEISEGHAGRGGFFDSHFRVMHRSDVVIADTPAECRMYQAQGGGRNRCVFLPPAGCEFEGLSPGAEQRPARVTYVDPAPRVDGMFGRVIEAFGRFASTHEHYELVVLGGRIPDDVELPAESRGRVTFAGRGLEGTLAAVLPVCRGLIVGSESAARWAPAVTALATATPLLAPRSRELESLHGSHAGVIWREGNSAAEVEGALRALAHDPAGRIRDMTAGRKALEATFGLEGLSERRWEVLSAAWTLKNYWLWTA